MQIGLVLAGPSNSLSTKNKVQSTKSKNRQHSGKNQALRQNTKHEELPKMKFVDDSQNLRGRLHLIQALVLVLLGVLSVRLYLLQIVNGSRYAEIAENQRIRLLPIPAPRGVIFDRNGKLLVDSRPIYSIILSREITKSVDYSLIKPLAEGLMIDEAFLRERVDQVRSQPAFESIL